MFLSNSTSSFLALIFILISNAGCGVLKTAENTSAPTPELPRSMFPFSTKELENFQCEITETAGEVVRRKRIAKKGLLRRVDFDFGDSGQRALLQTDKEYILDLNRGVYAERPAGAGAADQFAETTHELLNIGRPSEFEETGREGSIVRYIVRPADGSLSEIVVEYDESIGMPVKQRFYSIDGTERTLRFSIEVSGFKSDPDPEIFTLPASWKIVSIKELLGPLERR
jgi:hypothetical protein